MWENKTIFMGNASLDSKASFLKLNSFSCNNDMIPGVSSGTVHCYTKQLLIPTWGVDSTRVI